MTTPMPELPVVAYWIPKAEQFCLPPLDGTRPFAKQWEPLCKVSDAIAAIEASKEGDAKDARLKSLEEALEGIYLAYCSQMRSEYDFPGSPWTPERDNDEAALLARAAIASQKATQ